jgi:N-acyl amino acid synthase of PEP-CTERM/exosortase system
MHKQFIDDIEFTFSQAAFDTEIMREIYGLRYQVYCHECHFIREEDYPERIEKDAYDPHAVHFFTRTDHGIIGTARLILDNPHGFPFEALCGDSLCKEKLSGISRTALAEISRLVISKKLKKNYAAHHITPEDIVGKPARDKEEMNRIKHLAMGFYREIYQESKRRGINISSHGWKRHCGCCLKGIISSSTR